MSQPPVRVSPRIAAPTASAAIAIAHPARSPCRLAIVGSGLAGSTRHPRANVEKKSMTKIATADATTALFTDRPTPGAPPVVPSP